MDQLTPTAASGFVREAAEQLLIESPEVTVRWISLLQFVQFGIEAGFTTEQAATAFEAMRSSRSGPKRSLVNQQKTRY